jgi:hypothetical protein
VAQLSLNGKAAREETSAPKFFSSPLDKPEPSIQLCKCNLH